MFELLHDEKFREVAFIVCGVIFVFTVISYLIQKKDPTLKGGFASMVSWLVLAPVIFVICSIRWPYPLYALCLISIYGAKNFFQMTGMYHRSNFVWACYLGITLATYCMAFNLHSLFNFLPVLILFVISLIPLFRNSYKQMTQYIALTLLNFCFLWAFLHLGWIMNMSQGVYTVIFIILLTEFFDTLYLAISGYSKRIKLVSNITPKRSLEGFVLAGVITMVLGWGMRHLLPIRSDLYWGVISFICILFGSTGDTVLAVVRRDLGIKVTDKFILGRGDFFARLDRLVFVAPIAYYALFFLGELQ